ncbi:hypothetical protein DMB42_11660 [Nonomuraea sp. WAC 01424]|uniref:WDGH domain-containing protein n=1 Tax=Nonomuraea sp. WAC 01424 TaxID=2203200 RepID=UPI000F7ACA49|nr:hypothetical protein [Nonomuraea sp. WAC 01424]RSN12827.1 hypothetical protein DMB42_11660 [Nonomuraea sp. WAC 01424]
MSERKLTLSGGRGSYSVTLDGHDLSKGLRSLSIDVDPRKSGPRVSAELAIDAIEVTGLALRDSRSFVSMPDGAREALIALGWTPPREIPMDRREQAREWIQGFMATTDDDRVNVIALLLMAADDALECALNHKRAESDEPGQVEPESEGPGVYSERARLIAYLAVEYDSVIAYNDPNEPDWPVIYIDTPRGQLSWHLSPDDLHLFPHVPVAGRHVPIDRAPQWDGHTTSEKYGRLAALVADEVRGQGTA